MPRLDLHSTFGAILAGFLSLAALPGVAAADHLGRTVITDGMVVHLGIMPTEVLRENPAQYPAHDPGKLPSGRHMYHVMLALFDRATGERITDAQIEARVAPLGLSGPVRPLDPMLVAGVLTYCNYFRLSPTDTYVIKASIKRPDRPSAAVAKFVLLPHGR